MTGTQRVHHFLLLAIPVLLLTLLLPFMLTFDSVMYFVTRPTCLNCGSLGEYVRTSSLSVGVIGAMVGQLGAQYGSQIRDFFQKMGWRLPTSVGKKDDEKANYQLKQSSHE